MIVSLLPNAEDIARVDRLNYFPRAAATRGGSSCGGSIRSPVLRRGASFNDAHAEELWLSEMAHERQELHTTTQQLLESEVARRYIFFKGKIRGKVSDEDYDEDIHQDEDAMDPFGEYPKIHGHLELPVGWEGEVAGLYTIDGNPHDDGMGPIIFGITGTMTPDKLKLSFDYN